MVVAGFFTATHEERRGLQNGKEETTEIQRAKRRTRMEGFGSGSENPSSLLCLCALCALCGEISGNRLAFKPFGALAYL
jgi:hypothetical protein